MQFALWGHHTTVGFSIRVTPFFLTHEMEVVLLVEIKTSSVWVALKG